VIPVRRWVVLTIFVIILALIAADVILGIILPQSITGPYPVGPG
jgi:hypothetical protein